MYMQIDAATFRETFKAYNRQDNFSHDGLNALFEYLEEFESEVGPVEFDCIAICCEYSEQSFDDIINDYGLDVPEDEALSYILDYLEENTTIVAILEDSILYQVF